ncbi:MAG: ABC transporter substrate-binding protein [Limnochordia bacterium]|jgi:multiple sugar transport system substrate-binding protein
MTRLVRVLCRRFWLGALVLIVLLTPATVAYGKTTIVYLGRGGTSEQASYTKLIEQFEALHPDIDVEINWIPGGTAMVLMERLLVQVAAGVAPDVFWTHNYLSYDLLSLGLVLPLDPLMSNDPDFRITDYYPNALNDYLFNGKLYGLPRETSSTALYYSIDNFNNAGLSAPTIDWTWDTLLEAAKKLTDVNNKRWGLYAPTTHGTTVIMAWQNGGQYFDDTLTQPQFDAPENVQAFQWIADLMLTWGVSPKMGEVNKTTAFNTGQLGMLYDIRGATTNYGTASVDWDVAPLPKGKQHANRTASSGHAICAETKHPEAAWQLVKWLSGATAQREFAASGLSVPSMHSVATSPLFLNPDIKPKSDMVFLDMLQYARTDQVTRDYFSVVSAIESVLGQLWSGQLPAATVAQNVNRAVSSILANVK